MKTTHIIAAAALALAGAVGAQAQTTLNFDSLNNQYGDGGPYISGITGDAQFLSYTESGYVVTLHTSNGSSCNDGTCFGAHIGDGTGTPQTFNWHDNADNQPGAFVTLTKVGGGAFSLTSFDFFSYNDFSASATGYDTLNFYGTGGTVNPGFLNVTSVTFYGSGSQELDNITVNGGVPEPASWAMMLGGFGLVGGAMRRRRTAVRFA
jgi:hypothetical protein